MFTDPSCADQLLDQVGFPRERRPNHGQHSPSEWWHEALHEMQKGVVEDPIRRLVTAALNCYPHNLDLRRLLTQGEAESR
ncbi:effector-associated domain EAD1-containing protein [Frankia sp. CiP3]|uniref:effector-associated domain EAD1-containing protein n=1 Tax=Frankia sp. CiP3 TaxID=2880971 RepID=UPI0035ABF22D